MTGPAPTSAGAGDTCDTAGGSAAPEGKPRDASDASAEIQYSGGGVDKSSEVPPQLKPEDQRDKADAPDQRDTADAPDERLASDAPVGVAAQRPESQQRGGAIESGPGTPLDFWTEDENTRFVLALRADRYPPDWYELAGTVAGKWGRDGTER